MGLELVDAQAEMPQRIWVYPHRPFLRDGANSKFPVLRMAHLAYQHDIHGGI